jgi:hypothetical protein
MPDTILRSAFLPPSHARKFPRMIPFLSVTPKVTGATEIAARRKRPPTMFSHTKLCQKEEFSAKKRNQMKKHKLSIGIFRKKHPGLKTKFK